MVCLKVSVRLPEVFTMENESPEYLVSRLRTDDRAVLQQIFNQNYLMVCRTIRRFVQDGSLVEDLAQNVFIRFWNKRHKINITTSVPAYLNRMAINEAIAHLRKGKHWQQEEFTSQTPMQGTSRSGEDNFLHTELKEQVTAAIDTLPPKCRTVFQLSRFEELTYKEIAERLDISVKTVENQMGKALRVLREELKDYLTLIIVLLLKLF